MEATTPVLIGVGVAQQKFDQPQEAAEVYQLMVEAVSAAAVDKGSEYLLADAKSIYVPRGGVITRIRPGKIQAYKVLLDGDGKTSRAVTVCNLPEGKRSVAFSDDPVVMQRMMAEDLCGQFLNLAWGRFSL